MMNRKRGKGHEQNKIRMRFCNFFTRAKFSWLSNNNVIIKSRLRLKSVHPRVTDIPGR